MGKLNEIWNSFDKKKKVITIGVAVVILIAIIILIMCVVKSGKKEEPAPTKAPTATPTVAPTPTPTVKPTKTPTPEPTIPAGCVESSLTGEYIDEDVAAKRPFAVMFNNLSVASPQSGISEADILYECVTEGGITRLMGICQQITSDRVGSIRSARHYFVCFASEWDAIYIHCGGSDKAYDYIDSLGIDDIDGIKGIGGTLIYRDNSIKAPHNAFTSIKRINKCVKTLGYRTENNAKTGNHFTFYDEDTVAEKGDSAKYVEIKFSNYTTPYLKYNSKTKLYERYQFDEAHTDKNTGETLTFKNIIIMEVDEWNMDNAGRQDMAISDNSGDGYYISDGKAVKITWTKNQSKNIMKFLDADGNLLNVNKGKTYIAVLPLNRVADLVIK